MPMTLVELEKSLTALRLHGMARSLQARLLQAQQAGAPGLELLAALAQDELDARLSRLLDRRFTASGLAEKKLMNDFDWGFNPKLPKKEVFDLLTTAFVQNGDDVLIIGQPGTGKSHTAKAIAHAAIQAGFTVAYREEQTFFEDIFAASQTGKRKKLHKVLSETDLLVIDDLFLRKRVPDHVADDLMDTILERYGKRKSTLITSNRPLEDWGKLLGDNAASSAILDRLLHRGHLLKFEGNSYRLKEASKRLALESKKK
ncbi:MAG: ATP-binding protein [Rubrivivax sp.]|nr:ATP-binding protein [Rubrivivax sp.]